VRRCEKLLRMCVAAEARSIFWGSGEGVVSHLRRLVSLRNYSQPLRAGLACATPPAFGGELTLEALDYFRSRQRKIGCGLGLARNLSML
jgi:hypothetical protein